MILADRLADLRYRSAQRLKPEIHARVERQIAELQERKSHGKMNAGGTRAQSFDLATSTGERVSLDALIARGPVVLAFFRGTWCSFCSAEMLAFAEIYDRIVANGASFVAISPERPEFAAAWLAEHPLPFPLAFDEGNTVAEKFGIVYDFTDDARDLYANALGHDVAAINGDGKWRLPMPARYVIDRSGVIRDGEVDADFRERPEPTSVLTILASLSPERISSPT